VYAQPRECVWAHPLSNKTLIIRFRNAELKDNVNGVYGLLDESDTENPGAVKFEAYVDGAESYSGTVTYPGAQEFNIKTTAGKRELEFRISTGNDKMRHFCFNAWS
jgi:hypothetical protein